ncbi:MAG: hypothetical protein JW750_04945 [Anaerolineaceae bacterium]|nr:hypothetical protein [Anaerolineaceae bacterium]
MVQFFIWYLILFLIGLAAFPLSYRFLKRLPERGYSLAKALGLLLWGYLFWILGSLNFLQNQIGGVLFAAVLLCAVSAVIAKPIWVELFGWIRANKRMLIGIELVFFIGFAFWTVVRAANPELIGTEKPMELAFINAILKSESFPPHDPWLSGYSISYYYFGYVIVSMLVRLSGAAAPVGFNLMVALLFGLVSVGAYGILLNLLKIKFPSGVRTGLGALLGPFFILLSSNLEGFLEMLHARGLFWKQAADGSWSSAFWAWLKLPELTDPPSPPFGWQPERLSGYWWWRGSRVLQDFRANGDRIEIIDEFPQFTYLLADLHPHVLGMPFVLLAVGIALNLYLGGGKSAREKSGVLQWLGSWWRNRGNGKPAWNDLYVFGWLKDPQYWLFALTAGGIAFFNTWDFPIYVGLLCLANVLIQYHREGWSGKRWVEFFETGVLTGVLGVVFYLPFYLGFSSQAGGFLPSLHFYTRGIYFWIMFGGLLAPIGMWLLWQRKSQLGGFNRKAGWIISLIILIGLLVLSYALGGLILFGGRQAADSSLLGLFYWLQGSEDANTILLGSLLRRLTEPVTWVTLLGFLVLVWGLLSGMAPRKKQGESADSAVNGFVLVLILLGLGLTAVPEYIYLRDQFGNRMNTIFKFYFQSWILFGLAAGYVTAALWRGRQGAWTAFVRIVSVCFVLLSLPYTIFGIWDKTDGFSPVRYDESGDLVPDWSLDGALYRKRYNPDEMNGIEWLRGAELGVVAEAIGGSYSDYARVSTYSGQPTVLGWGGHESQWRGGEAEKGTREADIETLYRSSNWTIVREVLEQYEIRYIFVGDMERNLYNANLQKFDSNLSIVFEEGETVIYEYVGE